ncbi:MAG: arsenate reductase ArsC [Candidatus Omnitrophota bacterium]|jgi:glutathione/glutaredoxin type arsenate reductase|nr:arsenate reductase ArsC [Candidatus Omnitrophota bacterium]
MKKVLFVCVENSCRSQMAEGFARQYGGNVLEAYSAGSKPSGTVNPYAVKVMREAGIDISLQESKGFNELPAKEFDYVITLGCQDTCPFVPAVKHLEWQIEDPKGRDLDFFRSVRDNIKLKVQELIAAEREEK